MCVQRWSVHHGVAGLVKDKPSAVVFAIARCSGQQFDADSLYSFSRVTLVRTVDDLAERGVDVYVVSNENAIPARSDQHCPGAT